MDWRTVILERQETNKMSPMIGKFFVLREFPEHGSGRYKSVNSLSWRDLVDESRGKKVEIVEQSSWEKREAQRARWRYAEALTQLFTRILISTCMWENTQG